ncbi:CatB-related O-acetyltransferase [Vibrio aerogenes]|nr:Vat family streptogramin A O-acetyltransferase [Vibrio aerogenes]
MNGPTPGDKEPMKGFPQIGFVKNFISNPNIQVGDYTYYDDPDGPEHFESRVLYHFPFIGDQLIIGKFCAIARNITFIMNGANHSMTGFSTYPFYIFGQGWEKAAPTAESQSYKGDTVIGNDVWLGYDVTIMPGIRIGHGAIIAAKSVVTHDIPPYSIAGGHPASVIRYRFDQATIETLLEIAWWDWPAEKITANLEAIVNRDPQALRQAADSDHHPEHV